MSSKATDKMHEELRDGIETMPEMADIAWELPTPDRAGADDLLDEALMETFPASDPIASGKFE